MTAPPFNVGAFVWGAPPSPRDLKPHSELLTAYADGGMAEKGEAGEREAYLSHFAFGAEMRSHYAANRNSVAGFVGPCWCRWLVLDIDRVDLADALADARRLVTFLHDRYPEAEGDVPVFFSGGKGFHVLVELAHNPPPAVGFQRTARTLAEALAARAGVRIDTSVYDIAHIIRLPNTKHPRTGLFKRRIDADTLFRLDINGIREHARHAAGDGIPAVRTCPKQLSADWYDAGQVTARATETRDARRGGSARTPDERAPRYFLELVRFGVGEGERHQKLFQCAAWLTEQGAPPSLVAALLAEPGCDVGLTPKDVNRQIQCGIEHARRQHGATADPRPDPIAEPDTFERWAIRHEAGPLPTGTLDFPFGALAPMKPEGGTA